MLTKSGLKAKGREVGRWACTVGGVRSRHMRGGDDVIQDSMTRRFKDKGEIQTGW